MCITEYKYFTVFGITSLFSHFFQNMNNWQSELVTNKSVFFSFSLSIIHISPAFSTNRRICVQSLCYKRQYSGRHCPAVVVSLSSAETRPSIRAVQRCFVRSNSISEFLYRDPPHFQTDPGPVRSPLPAQSQKHAQHSAEMGTNPHLLTL